MNRFAEVILHAEEHGCARCKLEIEELGPLNGPEPPLDPQVFRWSMSPEEWAGQTVPDFEPRWR